MVCGYSGVVEEAVFLLWWHGCDCFFFFFKQKTAYEILTCDWSSDVCSSDLKINNMLKVKIGDKECDFEAGMLILLDLVAYCLF